MEDINLMNYKDIQTSIMLAWDNIEAARISVEYYEKEMTSLAPHNMGGMGLDSQPKGNRSPHTLDYCYDKVQALNEAIKRTTEYIQALEAKKREIDKKLAGLEGLKYQVAKLKLVDGMKLADIAEKLGYSESHIKRISAEIG